MKKLLLLFTSLFVGQLLSAQITIKGIITDDIGEPLIGATILVQGLDGIGAATEFDGTFSIDVPQLPIILMASYIGFEDQILNVRTIEHLKIELSEGELIECFISCCGPSRSMLVGPSHDVANNSSGVTAQIQLPYLLKTNPRLSIEGNWNFTNGINDINLRVERYSMPRIGPIGTSLVGKYRRINIPDIINLDQKILGAQFDYRGFELMVGYAMQKKLSINEGSIGPKNLINDSTADRANGFHVELSKTVFRILIQTEITHLKGISQYGTSLKYFIPGTGMDVRISLGNINGYQSAILGIRRRFRL